MADKIYKVKDPAGAIREIKGPEGATDDEVIAQAQKLFATPEADIADKIAGSIPGRVAIAAGAPIIGAAQFAANAADKSFTMTAVKMLAKKAGIEIPSATGINESVSHLKQMQDRGREASGSEGFDWASLAGSVMSPLGLATTKIAPAASAMGRVAQGTGLGAMFGATTPVTEGDFAQKKAEQTGMGAATGAVISGGIELAKPVLRAGYGAIEPTFESGRAAILKRFQEGLLGDSKGKVVSALQNAKEIVPGSKPTAGEAIAEIPEATGIAAHQKAIAKVPGVSGEFVVRDQAQQAARKSAISTVAQDKATLNAAEGARAGNALKNYGDAFNQAIKADPTLAQMSKNPYFKDALPDAFKLAEAKGITPKDDLTEFLHIVKLSMDKSLGKSGDTALSSTEKQAVATIKDKLIDWLKKKNPAYDTARQEFAKESVPINQMQVGQALEAKLIPPLENTERAASFAQAVRDAPGTIKRSTGFDRYDDLGKILSPQQMDVVNAINADLSRKAKFDRLAKGTNLTGATDIVEEGVRLPNLLSRPAMIANFIMKRLGHGADTKINKLAAEQYLDPQGLANALKDVPPGKVSQVIEALMKARNPAIAGAVYTGGH